MEKGLPVLLLGVWTQFDMPAISFAAIGWIREFTNRLLVYFRRDCRYTIQSQTPIYQYTLPYRTCNNGHFLVEVMPINAEDDIAESAAWDGENLYLIQRWHDARRMGLPRDKSLGFVEPNVFSRWATEALVSVLIAFADSNALTHLQDGQFPVNLGPRRLYPEENNTYTVRRLESGLVEIEAHCPGLELGSTDLIPIFGFDKGFLRWKHSSNLGSVSGAKGSIEEVVNYDRFAPMKGQLIQERKVTARILFDSEPEKPLVFRPTITESSLTVLDYSARVELFPYTKGIIDWFHQYELTNRIWNYDTNLVSKTIADVKTLLAKENGPPKELIKKSNSIYAYESSPSWGKRRIMIVGILIIISILPLGWLWHVSRRTV